MKLSIKGLAFSMGFLTAIAAFWCILMNLVGIGDTPYNFLNEFYLGWISPTIKGLIFGTVLAFIDGAICGAILAWLYNKIAK